MRAVAPYKPNYSDAGFDLSIVELVKKKGKVHYYTTGIQVSPPVGYYFEIVGRSSISKSGWMLANNIGIIDSGYRGDLLAALIKVDENAPDIELP